MVIIMRKLISAAVLLLAAMPSFAVVGQVTTVPEPEALALLAIGGLAMVMSRSKK